jgi:hypothetical protein
MKFAHLVEINDPLNPLIDTLTREQVWRGLVKRAEDPKSFVPWLDACIISERSPALLRRELRYGDVVIQDRVTFLPLLQIRYLIPEQKDIPASSLSMTIEEPGPGQMFVRFEYESADEENEEAAFYNEFRRSAYQESDIDTIRIIRQLAAQGLLDSPAA